MRWSSDRYEINRATRRAALYETDCAVRDVTYYATHDATHVPNHPTSDHITALLQRAKEVAR